MVAQDAILFFFEGGGGQRLLQPTKRVLTIEVDDGAPPSAKPSNRSLQGLTTLNTGVGFGRGAVAENDREDNNASGVLPSFWHLRPLLHNSNRLTCINLTWSSMREANGEITIMINFPFCKGFMMSKTIGAD